MFSGFWKGKEKTRFETAKEFERIDAILKLMRIQRDALKRSAKSDGVGSLSEFKYKIYNEILTGVDSLIKQYNEDAPSLFPTINALEKRELLIKMAHVMNGINQSKSDTLNTNRGGANEEKRSTLVVPPIQFPLTYGMSLEETLDSVGICTYYGLSVGTSEKQAEPVVRTYSQDLANKLSNLLNNVYKSLSYDMSSEQRKDEYLSILPDQDDSSDNDSSFTESSLSSQSSRSDSPVKDNYSSHYKY